MNASLKSFSQIHADGTKKIGSQVNYFEYKLLTTYKFSLKW